MVRANVSLFSWAHGHQISKSSSVDNEQYFIGATPDGLIYRDGLIWVPYRYLQGNYKRSSMSMKTKLYTVGQITLIVFQGCFPYNIRVPTTLRFA